MKSKILLFFVCIFLLFSCSPSKKDQDGKADNRKKILKFAFWDSNQLDGLNSLISDFSSTYKDKNVQIDVEITPWAQYWTSLGIAAQGNNLPDIVTMNAPNIEQYARGGKLLNLKDTLTQNNVNLKNFIKPVVNIYSINNGVYALPRDYDSIAVWYNKKILSNIGMTMTEQNRPKTWEDLKIWGEKIKNALKAKSISNVYPLLISSTATQDGMWNFIAQNGGYVIKPDGSSGYDMPETLEALKFVYSLVKEKIIPSAKEEASFGEGLSAMSSGKFVAFYGGIWNIAFFKSLENGKDFDMIPMPMNKKTDVTGIIHGVGTAVAANTKYPKIAKDFIVYLASDRAANILASKNHVVPAKKGFLDSYLEANKNYKYLKMILKNADKGQMHYRSLASGWDIIDPEEYAKMYDSVQTPEETAANIKKRANSIFDRGR